MSFAANGYFYLSTGIAGNNRLKEAWRLAFSPEAAITENQLLAVYNVLQEGILIVRVNPILIGEELKIRDLQGRILHTQQVQQIEEKISLNLHPIGTYFIEIRGYSRKCLVN